MKKKKSRIELAREIIASLRRGMNRPLNGGTASTVQPTYAPSAPPDANRAKGSNQLQTSRP